MAVQYGNLLVNRRRLTLAAGQTAIDTGIRINTNNFSPDPGLPSRLMVLVQPPTGPWDAITAMSEPYFVGTTLTIDFNCASETTVNVLFWLPHSLTGPLSADAYGASCALVTNIDEICVVSQGGS